MVAPTPDRSPSAPVPLAPIARRGYPPLPAQLTPLIGRGTEIETLVARLQQPDVRLVTLVGPGGVGKTRLALAVAGALETAFADGVSFVPLATVLKPAFIAMTIAQALGVREASGRPLTDALLAALMGRELLLVLDNLEHLLEVTPLIAELLVACHGLKVLATSRAVLRLTGEHDVPVPPLALPAATAGLMARDALTSPAIQLFVARATAARPDFVLNDANAGAVCAICHRLDGLPLAIELAAAHTRHLPPTTLLQHLDAPFNLLRGGPRDQPPRLRAMRDAIAWSYDLLPAEEQAFFRRLAVLAGSGSLDAVAAIIRGPGDPSIDVLDGVGALVAKSLLAETEDAAGEPRYAMLETVREFGVERLRESGEEAAARSAHAAYFLAMAADAEPHLIAPGSSHWVEQLAVERANLRAAADWALRHGRADAVLRLAGTILSFAYARGEPREGQLWLEAALAFEDAGTPEERVDALFTASALAQVRGDFEHSTTLSEQGLAIARAHGYDFGEARFQMALGITAEWQGDLELAASHYEVSRVLMTGLRDARHLPHWTLLPLANLADVALLQGDPARAALLAEEAVAGWRLVDYRWGMAQALGTAAAAASEQGDQVRAGKLFGETLSIWLDSDDGRGIAGTLAGIAGMALHRGRLEQAARLLGAAWGVADNMGVRYLAHHVHAERVRASTQDRLDEHAFAEAWDAGRHLTLAGAVDLAWRILAPPAPVRHPAARHDPALTPREQDVLHLLVTGQPDREIAGALRISPRTVQTHVASLFAKFGVNSRVELTAITVRRGLA